MLKSYSFGTLRYGSIILMKTFALLAAHGHVSPLFFSSIIYLSAVFVGSKWPLIIATNFTIIPSWFILWGSDWFLLYDVYVYVKELNDE